MFSPHIQPTMVVNLWHPYPEPHQGLNDRAFQRSLLPGDVISFTSDGRANVRFNIFHSESENRFYGHFPPTEYVAFGPPLESYQRCEEHSINRPRLGIQTDNCKQKELAVDDHSAQNVPGGRQTVYVTFFKNEPLCMTAYILIVT